VGLRDNISTGQGELGAHLGQSNGIALGTEPPVQKIAGGTEKGRSFHDWGT